MPKLKLFDKIHYEKFTKRFIELSGKPLTAENLTSLRAINKMLDGLAIKAMRLPGLPFGAKGLWVDQSVKRHQVIATRQKQWDTAPQCPSCHERFPNLVALSGEGEHPCPGCREPFTVHGVRSTREVANG